jgi:hypothetical protein
MARRKRNVTSKAARAVEFAMASDSQESLKRYLDRGRRFASFSADELQRAFVSACLIWGRNPVAPASRLEYSEIDSEYSLRGEKPPYSLVRNHINSVKRGAEALVKGLSEERLAQIDSDLMEEYEKALAGKN